MAFDFSTLEPQIRQILSAPGTDLATISAKRVRRQLLDLNPSLTAEFLKENKDNVDAIISGVFEQVSPVDDTEDAGEHPVEVEEKSASRKRRQQEVDEQSDGGDEEEESPPPSKKAKKSKKNDRGVSDAELARKLSSEINSRSTRTGGKSRGSSNSGAKKGGRKKKSAATVNSDDDSDDNVTEKKPKKPSGGAKGGFAKEFLLSEPLAAVLQVDKLSRPQVVKQLWVYIKGNELQNPENKREIMCDVNLKAVFGVDKIDMFKMNKVLGQHLHENEG